MYFFCSVKSMEQLEKISKVKGARLLFVLEVSKFLVRKVEVIL